MCYPSSLSTIRNLERCCSSQLWGCKDVMQNFLAIASISGLFSIPYEHAACGKAVQAKLSLFVRHGVYMRNMSLLDLPGERQISPTLLRSVAHSCRLLFFIFLLERVNSLSSAFKTCFVPNLLSEVGSKGQHRKPRKTSLLTQVL